MKKIIDAVSPVVGVMMMLVLVIIIAAVISAFAGGLSSSVSQSPISATFDCSISNDGTWERSSFNLICAGVDGGIKSRDLKIITSWKASDGTTGGETTTASDSDLNVMYNGVNKGSAPFGFGSGISSSGSLENYNPDQYFGNYSFMTGTRATCTPYGSSTSDGGYGTVTKYEYTSGSDFDLSSGDRDAMIAVLGEEWNKLTPGDRVEVRVVHIPSSTLVYDGTVTVE